jgi:hypothetical protein
MNDATTYEQMRIFDLFVDNHPKPRVAIFGVDRRWCAVEIAPNFTVRPFPPWLYDDNSWNDVLYLLNFGAVEQAGRQFARLVGWRAPKYGLDGYTNFLPPESEYDLAKARSNIYGQETPIDDPPPAPPPDGYAGALARLTFPQHVQLQAMLSRLPAESVKVLFFVPYHRFYQGPTGSRRHAVQEECKRRVLALAAGMENVHALDFMIASEITRRDDNYWDPLHFKPAVSRQVMELIAIGVNTRRGRDGYFRYLAP